MLANRCKLAELSLLSSGTPAFEVIWADQIERLKTRPLRSNSRLGVLVADLVAAGSKVSVVRIEDVWKGKLARL